MRKINLKDVDNFIHGNLNKAIYDLGGKSKEYQEQIAYRALQCQDCFKNRQCQHCGCSLPGRWHSIPSCNKGERFPDLMSDEEWREYKKIHGIK